MTLSGLTAPVSPFAFALGVGLAFGAPAWAPRARAQAVQGAEHGEPQEAGDAGLPLGQAQLRAEADAPAVVVSVARREVADAGVDVAEILPNPRVTLGTQFGAAKLYTNFFMWLPLFGQRAAARDAASAEVRVAEAGVDVARLDARLAVTLAWIDLWQIEAEQALAVDEVARRVEVVSITEARYAEGSAPRVDILRAEAERSRVEAARTALEDRHAAASARLALALGQDEGLALRTAGAPDPTAAPPNPDERAAAIAAHPLALRAERLLGAADAGVERERRARRPLVGVQVTGYLWERYPPPRNEVVAAVVFDVPLFDAPRVRQAEEARGSAEAELAAVLAELRAGLASAFAEYLAADRTYDAQANVARPAVVEAAQLAAEAYRSGALDLTGLLDAEQGRADALLAKARARAERARAFGRLEHALGRSL